MKDEPTVCKPAELINAIDAMIKENTPQTEPPKKSKWPWPFSD